MRNFIPCVEAGSNTSTVTLRVVKYGYESKGTRTQERLRWRVPAAYTKVRPVLSSERTPTRTGP
jgi:hypothetical protein